MDFGCIVTCSLESEALLNLADAVFAKKMWENFMVWKNLEATQNKTKKS